MYICQYTCYVFVFVGEQLGPVIREFHASKANETKTPSATGPYELKEQRGREGRGQKTELKKEKRMKEVIANVSQNTIQSITFFV